MELLLILLTGFFLWLWLYDSSRRSYTRLRTEAGELLYIVPQKGKSRRIQRILALILFVEFFCILLIHIIRPHDDLTILDSFSFVSMISMAFIFFFPPFFIHVSFEIHEKGLVARGLFAPWCEIQSYSEIAKGIYKFDFKDFSKSFSFPINRRNEIQAALSRFLEVRKLNEPNNHLRTGHLHTALHRPRFQFDLRSLLLFFIFASSLSSLGGILYHRWDVQRRNLAALDAFQPKVVYSRSQVWILDFSASPKKPSDDDLPLLLKYPRLQILNLYNAPITDAGLEQLAALKNPVVIYLTGTQVTAQGVKRLKKALPKSSEIIWTPPAPPPSP